MKRGNSINTYVLLELETLIRMDGRLEFEWYLLKLPALAEAQNIYSYHPECVEDGKIKVRVGYEPKMKVVAPLKIGDEVLVSRDKKTFVEGTIVDLDEVRGKLMKGISVRLNQPSINYGRKVEVAPMRIVERDVPEHLDADQLRELVKKDQAEEKKV